MDKNRWESLMKDDQKKLTSDEISEGWHFCWDWDGLLISPESPEYSHCSCICKKKTALPSS